MGPNGLRPPPVLSSGLLVVRKLLETGSLQGLLSAHAQVTPLLEPCFGHRHPDVVSGVCGVLKAVYGFKLPAEGGLGSAELAALRARCEEQLSRQLITATGDSPSLAASPPLLYALCTVLSALEDLASLGSSGGSGSGGAQAAAGAATAGLTPQGSGTGVAAAAAAAAGQLPTPAGVAGVVAGAPPAATIPAAGVPPGPAPAAPATAGAAAGPLPQPAAPPPSSTAVLALVPLIVRALGKVTKEAASHAHTLLQQLGGRGKPQHSGALVPEYGSLAWALCACFRLCAPHVLHVPELKKQVLQSMIALLAGPSTKVCVRGGRGASKGRGGEGFC